MTKPWRILVVDDSTLSREALRRAMELDPQLTVVGEAKTGEEALQLARTLQPDLITMDLNMPGMGGLKAIELLMKERPTPVVVISERSSTTGVDLNYEALSRGALDLVPKSAVFGVGPQDVKAFVERIRRLAFEGLDREAPITRSPTPTIPVSHEAPMLVGIGSSTGGPRALGRLFSKLPPDFPLPIALVQHMAEEFFESFVRFLSDTTGRKVVPATHGMWLEPGMIAIAPPRQEMFVKENLSVKLLPPPPDALLSPSVDSLFFSMANALKGRGVGVLLTGMGDDGAQGLLRMRRLGARTLVQDRESCAVFGMPRAAMELGAAETVLPLEQCANYLVEATRDVRAASSRKSRVPQRRKVLIVDDDPATLEASRAALESGGYDVTPLDNPLIVAQTLRKNEVDLVLLETELVTMKGAVVVQTLRAHGLARVPLFLLSALEPATLKKRAEECGAIGFVRKGSPTLLAEVNAFLGGPQRSVAR